MSARTMRVTGASLTFTCPMACFWSLSFSSFSRSTIRLQGWRLNEEGVVAAIATTCSQQGVGHIPIGVKVIHGASGGNDVSKIHGSSWVPPW